MNKLAVFVEGQTEQMFVEKLLIEIAGRNNIWIVKRKSSGDANYPRKHIHLNRDGDERKYFVYIKNCHGESSVKSDIVENYLSLVNSGYTAIIGIRDVYPNFKHNDIPKLKQLLRYGVKTKPFAPVFILSVMEIEAWFLAEHTHFQKIHPKLSIDRIKSELNFDPSRDNMEMREHPAEDLHAVYALEGMQYLKWGNEIKRTVHAIDYESLYLELRHKIQPIKELCAEIDNFMEIRVPCA